jgi:hypothetical protein
MSTLHPAFEDGTDGGFRNVGKSQSDAREIPKRTHTIFKTRWKFEIKNTFVVWNSYPTRQLGFNSQFLSTKWIMEALSWGIKQAKHEDDNTHPPSSKVQNAKRCILSPHKSYVVWCLLTKGIQLPIQQTEKPLQWSQQTLICNFTHQKS